MSDDTSCVAGMFMERSLNRCHLCRHYAGFAPTMPRFPLRFDHTDEQFDRLHVQHFFGMHRRIAYWCCLCLCSNATIVRGQELRNHHTRSCGCLCLATLKRINTTHGMSKTALFKRWEGMIARCTNPRAVAYAYYGGRGITVCDRWLTSFQNFYQDMGHPSAGLSLERKDNHASYSPENCYWATRQQQMNNTRRNHFITYNDITKTSAEWARTLGMEYGTFIRRVRNGWTMEDILCTPVRPSSKKGTTR